MASLGFVRLTAFAVAAKINVGVAVAVENGLLTVVSKVADQKPLHQISINLKRMAAGAREGKVINHRIIERIASKTSLIVDFGGGIASDTGS